MPRHSQPSQPISSAQPRLPKSLHEHTILPGSEVHCLAAGEFPPLAFSGKRIGSWLDVSCADVVRVRTKIVLRLGQCEACQDAVHPGLCT